MSSIILSFVGKQDPYSDSTHEEGSIITLVRHLLGQQCQVSRVILLYTTETKQRAQDTQDWLESELNLPEMAITRVEVDPALSDDPVALLLAVKEARQGLEMASADQREGDYLELNASSGTPVMKSAWSILQAAGYGQRSRVWQVRNPKQIRPDQVHVFETNVDTLKREFDLKVVQQQIADYNYSGALVTLKSAGLHNETAIALLEYGRCRKAFDFNTAYSYISPVAEALPESLVKDMALLRKGDSTALARECYYIALTKLKNCEYADFLVLLASFQESILRSLLQNHVGINLKTSVHRGAEDIWRDIRTVDSGKLFEYLKKYRLENGSFLKTQGFLNSTVMTAMLSYYPGFESVETHLESLKGYVRKRNNQVHRLEGVSKLDDEEQLLLTLRKILKQVVVLPPTSPFDQLSEEVIRIISI